MQVEFNRETEEEGTKTVKHNKRILFQRMAPYPQRKVITFNRYSDDFAFDINYGDLSFLSQEDLRLDSCLFSTFCFLNDNTAQRLDHFNCIQDSLG